LDKDILRGILSEVEKEIENLNELRKEMKGIYSEIYTALNLKVKE